MKTSLFVPSSRMVALTLGIVAVSLTLSSVLFTQFWLSGNLAGIDPASQSAAVSNKTPVGWLDTFNTSGYVSGWAVDPDSASQSIKVNVYLDGPTGSGTKILSFTASSSRPDVNRVTGYPGNHGFRVELPTTVANGQHSVYAYAVDTTTGVETALAGNPRSSTLSRKVTTAPSCREYMPPYCPNGTLVSNGTDTNGCSLGYTCKEKDQRPSSCREYMPPYCPNGTLVSNGTDTNGCSLGYTCDENPATPVNEKPPKGWLDTFASNGYVSGWTLDPDSSSAAIKVKLYVDGPAGQGSSAGTFTASSPRPDVNNTTGYPGNHGFRVQLPETVTNGTRTIYAYGIDPVSGAETALSGSPKTTILSRGTGRVTEASCTFNGSTVAHGSSVTAYKTSSVAQGQTCQSETRSCANGTLSGSYAYSSCSVETPASDKIMIVGTTTNQTGAFIKTIFAWPLSEKVVYTGMKGSVSSQNTKNTFGQMLYTVFWKPTGQCPTSGEQYTTYSQISSKYTGLRTLAKVILKNSVSGTAIYPINFTLPRGIEISNCVFVIMDGSLLSGGSYTMNSNLELLHKKDTPAPKPTVTTLPLGDEVCFGMSSPDSCGGWRTNDTTSSFIRYSKKFTSNTELLSIQGSFADAAMSADLMGLLGGRTVSGTWTAKNDYYILPNCPNTSTTAALSAGPGEYYATLPGDAINIYSSTMTGSGVETLKHVINKNFTGTVIPKDGCLAHIVKVSGNGAVDAESQFVAFLSATSTPAKPKPSTPEGYDIIVVAGQSNAVGAGAGPFTDTAANSTVDAKIFQLGRRGNDNLKVISPFWTSGGKTYDALQHAGLTGNRALMGFAIPFARRYAASELAEGRKILIVPAARGGTSISDWMGGGQYSPTLYDDMKSRVNTALTLPGNNKIVAVLWHQGESDVQLDTPTSVFSPKLNSFVTKMRQDFPSNPKYPILAGMMVPTWEAESSDKARIEGVIRSVFNPNNNSKTGIVESSELGAYYPEYSTNPLQAIHFSSPALVEFGDRYFEKWKSVKNTLTVTEALGNVVTSLGNLSSKMMGAVWQAILKPF